MDQSIGDTSDAGVIIEFFIRNQIMHVDNGNLVRRICFTPGPESTGPSEGANGSVMVRRSLID